MIEKTQNVLISTLLGKELIFEIDNDDLKPKTIELFKRFISHIPIVEIQNETFYRARVIADEDGMEQGIVRENGIPITGYNTIYSGVPPKEVIKHEGRVNRINEQVLYIAEDQETAIRELKDEKSKYFSVAEYFVKEPIKVFDCSAFTKEQLEETLSPSIRDEFENKYQMSLTILYIKLQEHLTFGPSKKDGEKEYKFSLKMIDFMKEYHNISGVKYVSSYTYKSNVAIWDDNKFLKCVNSMVERKKGKHNKDN
ncbi:MAG: RES domain-containing protein [Eubacteriales bacterium]